MMLDANLQFSNAQAITVSAASAGVYDQGLGVLLTGTTYTNPVGMIFGKGSFFDDDLGVGQGVGTPRIVVSSGPAAFLSGTSLAISFQTAVDNGSGLLTGLTWNTDWQSGAILTASLLANQRLVSFDWPMRIAGVPIPRFARLFYTTVGTFTAGAVNADVTLGHDDAQQTLPQASGNFTVAA